MSYLLLLLLLLPLPIAALRFGQKLPKRNRPHRQTSSEPSSDLRSRSLGKKTSNFGDGSSHPFRLDRSRPEVEELFGPFTMYPAMEATLALIHLPYPSKSSNHIAFTFISNRLLNLEATYSVLVLCTFRRNAPHPALAFLFIFMAESIPSTEWNLASEEKFGRPAEVGPGRRTYNRRRGRLRRMISEKNRLHRRTSLEPSGGLGSRSLEPKTSNFGDGFPHPFRLVRARPEIEERPGPSTMGPPMEATFTLPITTALRLRQMISEKKCRTPRRTQYLNWTVMLNFPFNNRFPHPALPPLHPCAQIEDALRRSASILGLRSFLSD